MGKGEKKRRIISDKSSDYTTSGFREKRRKLVLISTVALYKD